MIVLLSFWLLGHAIIGFVDDGDGVEEITYRNPVIVTVSILHAVVQN